MSVSAEDEIPLWPPTSATLHDDGRVDLSINGTAQSLTADSVDDARGIVLKLVAEYARDHVGRAVRLRTTDPDGEWELAVYPDGHSEALPRSRRTVPRGTPRAGRRTVPRGTPRRSRTLLASGLVVLAALVVVIGASLGSSDSSTDRGRLPRTAVSAPTASAPASEVSAARLHAQAFAHAQERAAAKAKAKAKARERAKAHAAAERRRARATARRRARAKARRLAERNKRSSQQTPLTSSASPSPAPASPVAPRPRRPTPSPTPPSNGAACEFPPC